MKMIVMCVARLLVVATLAASLTGCNAQADNSRTTVVTGLYPYAYVVQRVGGQHVETVDLTSAGVEPHDLELTPQQIAAISDADLVVYQSGFQPAIDAALDQADSTKRLDVTRIAGLTEQPATDPHLWLDPTKLAGVAKAVGRRLTGLDPSHADRYQANARALATQLRQLDRDYRRGLAECARDVFVTSHAAFGYLADRYGLRMVAIAGLDPHTEPSPERQAQIVDAVRGHGVSTVFTEPLVSPAVAKALAEDTGATVATLDPIEGPPRGTDDGDYFSLMRANLTALRQANGCR